MPLSRLRPLVVCCALLLGASLPATASDTPSEVAALRGALTTRVDAIGPSPTDRAQKKEAKKLAKASDAFAAYQGNDDLADLITIGKAAKQIAKSKTEDTTIRAELDDLLGCVAEIVAGRSTEAQQALDTLTTDKYRGKLQSILDKAGAKLADAQALITSDPQKAHGGLRKAWTLFEKAIAKGEKFGIKESAGGGGSPGGNLPKGVTLVATLNGTYLQNDSTTRYYVQDVIFSGVIKNASGEVVWSRDDFGVRSLAPDQFKVTSFPDGSFDAPNLVERRFPEFPSAPLFSLGELISLLGSQVPLVLESHTFEGTMKVVLSKKKSGGGKLYRGSATLAPSIPFFPFDPSGF